MWRGTRADWIVHDQVLPGHAALWAFVLLGIFVGMSGDAPWLTPVGLLALLLRRRVGLHRPSGRVRLAWVLAPTPHTPGIPLRTLTEIAVSGLSEVRVGPPLPGQRLDLLTYFPIELAFRAPAYRGGEFRESVIVAACIGHERTLAAAGRLAADLGLTVRDVEASPPSVQLGM